MKINLANATQTTNSNEPNFVKLQQEYGEFNSYLADLIKNLQAYISDPTGPNAEEEEYAFNRDMGYLDTLTNPSSPNSLFAAMNGNPNGNSICWLLNGLVGNMSDLLNAGDLQGFLDIAAGARLNGALGSLFSFIYQPST